MNNSSAQTDAQQNHSDDVSWYGNVEQKTDEIPKEKARKDDEQAFYHVVSVDPF
jgi:hypothetical protein